MTNATTAIQYFTVEFYGTELTAAIDYEEKVIGLTDPDQVANTIDGILEEKGIKETIEIIDDETQQSFIIENQEYEHALDILRQELFESFEAYVLNRFGFTLEPDNCILESGIPDYHF